MSYQINSTRAPGGAVQRYSAKRVIKPVNFVCSAPGAKQVSVIGDFNNWQRDADPMKRQPDGAWMVQVQLCDGHHQYLFFVDGQAYLDPHAQGVARTPEGERVSIIAIS